jgi:hypothetical protein
VLNLYEVKANFALIPENTTVKPPSTRDSKGSRVTVPPGFNWVFLSYF